MPKEIGNYVWETHLTSLISLLSSAHTVYELKATAKAIGYCALVCKSNSQMVNQLQAKELYEQKKNELGYKRYNWAKEMSPFWFEKNQK